MIEPKVSLTLLVPGAVMLSSQECEENPKENYDKHKVFIRNIKGKGKVRKETKEALTVKTRKQKLVPQIININKEAYENMLDTPTSTKLAKPIKVDKDGKVLRVWDTLSIHKRLEHHFDLIVHDFRAVSYNYDILDD